MMKIIMQKIKTKKSLLTILLISILLIITSCSEGSESDSSCSATWDPEKEILPVSVEALTVTEGKLIPSIDASGIIYG